MQMRAESGGVVVTLGTTEYWFDARGEVRCVGFTDPETPRTPEDWDAAYREAEAWAREHTRTILDALRQYSTAAAIAAVSAMNVGAESVAALMVCLC
jgi:hypothetical protein